MRAGRLEVARRALDRGADLGVGGTPQPASSIRPMLEALERRGLDRPVELLVFEARIVAHVRQRQRRHHQRGVGRVARHRAGDAADIGRVDRHAAGARLEAEYAAPAGRQAHRAADVGADMQRAIERRRRRARARRRAARIAVELPWIARERMKARQARRQHAVVGHRRLGEEDRAGFAQPRRRRRVGLAAASCRSPRCRPASGRRASRYCP